MITFLKLKTFSQYFLDEYSNPGPKIRNMIPSEMKASAL